MRSPFFHFLCFTVLRFFGVEGGGTLDGAREADIPEGDPAYPVVVRRAGATETREGEAASEDGSDAAGTEADTAAASETAVGRAGRASSAGSPGESAARCRAELSGETVLAWPLLAHNPMLAAPPDAWA